MNGQNNAYFTNGDRYALPNKPGQRHSITMTQTQGLAYNPYGDDTGVQDHYSVQNISEGLGSNQELRSHAGVSIHSNAGMPVHNNAGMPVHSNAGMSVHSNSVRSVHSNAGMSIHSNAGMSTHSNAGMSIQSNAGFSFTSNPGVSLHNGSSFLDGVPPPEGYPSNSTVHSTPSRRIIREIIV